MYHILRAHAHKELKIFEHLIDPQFTEIGDASPSELLAAQMNTVDWLDADDDSAVSALPPSKHSADMARQAFTSMMDGAPVEVQREHVMQLRAPQAVRHLVGMLSAYDWAFVEQAKELRGYVVAQLLEETKNKDARIRLRALELVGKLTEVASFCERSEVIHKQEPSAAIEDRLRARLKSLLPPVMEVQDTEVKDIAVVNLGSDEEKA